MAEKIDVVQQIVQLVQLQDIDSQIYRLYAEKETKPEEIKQLKDSLNQKQSTLKETESSLKSLQAKRKEKEIELGTKETEVKKLQVQLYQLKTNKEYTTMLHEIEGHQADNSILEDEILRLMDEIDAVEAKMRQEKKVFEEESKRIDAEINKIEDRVEEIEKTLTELKKKREKLTPTISPQLFKNYEKILEGREGLALVEVINDACGGCYMYLPPQIINEIKMREHIVYCESCQRMLYIRDEVA